MNTTDSAPARPVLVIDNREIPIEGERNVLEMARKAGIDIPTFCYHSELSVYGACRLCLVDVEGRGIQASCSIAPEPGMRIRTNTQEVRNIRKIAIELLLANHDMNCPTCPKSAACRLQDLARRMGIDEIRYKTVLERKPIDRASYSLVRDPNKCILCGDCVRACHEIQGVGAIDFAHRGVASSVLPAFGRNLDQGECVYCGKCASVCPTGALTPRPETDAVWKALDDPNSVVVAQLAPAVRVGLGESFGMAAGSINTGQAVAALKALGFDKVYDTSFAADMTVLEESTEFLGRVEKGGPLPIFTSCCPAWVKFAEQYYPDLLPNLSSCKSPQQMFGSVARKILPEQLGTEGKKLVIVSVMPCTAKKFEAKQAKFAQDGQPDVDHVITTVELGLMIQQAGLNLANLEPESFDMPLGFKSGAGVIFGASGGVTEAVLRYAVEKVQGFPLKSVDFFEVRGEAGLREATVQAGGLELKLAVVHGLANARRVAEQVLSGERQYHLIEVMACPGGCVAGAGQPSTLDPTAKRQRAKALYHNDKMLELHKAQDNYELLRCYEKHLGAVGGHEAHELLHTEYQNRRRILDHELKLIGGGEAERLDVSVCVGTGCFLNGSQEVLKGLMAYVEAEGLEDVVDLRATFCVEQCGKGPNVRIGGQVIEHCTLEMAQTALKQELDKITVTK
jgi:NADH-quinone oxidoreductase subunit G